MNSTKETARFEELSAEKLHEMLDSSMSTRWGSDSGLKSQKDIELPREELSEEPSRKTGIFSGIRAWTVLKVVVTMACLSGVFYETANIYLLYHSFPTTTNTKVVTPTVIKFPAITICFSQTISRNSFCEFFPDLCQTPYKLFEFCQKHSHFCKRNISNLVIPKLGYHANSSREEIRKKLIDLISRSKAQPPTPDLQVMYVEDSTLSAPVRCYSTNLHLLHGVPKSIPENQLSSGPIFGPQTYIFTEWKVFYPWMTPKMFFSIHSPFVPVNPLLEKNTLRTGYEYDVYIRMEEEHLLPEPYQTNCTDYEALRKRRKVPAPRSQEMCRDMCNIYICRDCAGCESPFTMMETTKGVCDSETELESEINAIGESWDQQQNCLRDCRPSCVNLKYPFTVTKRALDPMNENRDNEYVVAKEYWFMRFKFSLPFINLPCLIFTVHLENHDVKITSHHPLHNIGDVFSYIGGLIGCCLGISEWVLGDLMKSIFRSIARLIGKLKQKSRRLKTTILAEPSVEETDLSDLHSCEGDILFKRRR